MGGSERRAASIRKRLSFGIEKGRGNHVILE